VVENRPGAGANIGIEMAARAAPDGYTLLTTSSNYLANPALFSKVRYDPIKDFVPIVSLLRTPAVLIVTADSPYKSARELIAAARAQPGKLAYASGGNGSMAHFAGELLKGAAGIDLLHTPYKGGPETLTSLLARNTDCSFPILVVAMPYIRSGQFRALAVTSHERMPQIPDVPTMWEVLGDKGFDLDAETGLVAPVGTPAAVVGKLNAEFTKLMREPAIADPLFADGYAITAGTPEAFGASIARDVRKFAEVVRRSGAKID